MYKVVPCCVAAFDSVTLICLFRVNTHVSGGDTKGQVSKAVRRDTIMSGGGVHHSGASSRAAPTRLELPAWSTCQCVCLSAVTLLANVSVCCAVLLSSFLTWQHTQHVPRTDRAGLHQGILHVAAVACCRPWLSTRVQHQTRLCGYEASQCLEVACGPHLFRRCVCVRGHRHKAETQASSA